MLLGTGSFKDPGVSLHGSVDSSVSEMIRWLMRRARAFWTVLLRIRSPLAGV